MRRALGLVVLVFLLTWVSAAFAEGYTSVADPLFGLGSHDETIRTRIAGRGGAPPTAPEPSRVILWDDEPPRGNSSAHCSRAT